MSQIFKRDADWNAIESLAGAADSYIERRQVLAERRKSCKNFKQYMHADQEDTELMYKISDINIQLNNMLYV